MRYYTETTKDIFLAKVEKLMTDREFPWELPNSIEKDLSKVNFDWKNYSVFGDDYNCGYPVGHKELVEGFHIYFCAAGGDWECPVCFVFYNTNEGLRAYIPKDGNLWNKKEKCAYGSESNFDEAYADGGEKDPRVHEYSESKIINDILSRIIKNDR